MLVKVKEFEPLKKLSTKSDAANKVTTQYIAQKMKFFITHFFSKCDQIRRKLRIWSHLLKKSIMENFIFCTVIQEAVSNISITEKSYIPKKFSDKVTLILILQ